MYVYEDLRTLHLEITQRCNAACPQCSRFTTSGILKPEIPETELSLQDIKDILPEALLRQLALIYLCGNYGDPIIAKDTIPILQYFRKAHPGLEICVHTNGAARNVRWWRALAKVSSSCVFGIDGLADTNHLYRVGTTWDRLMENAIAYIGAGGNAEWQFLVFKHNEHQIEEAKRLSERMGFRRFFVKSTTRFLKTHPAHEVEYPVQRLNKAAGYVLRPTSRLEFRNSQIVQLESEVGTAVKYAKYLETTDIMCKAIKERSFYISAEGLVLPCCWLSCIYEEGRTRDESQIGRVLSALAAGFASIDARRRSVKEIVDSDLFQRIIPSLWSKDAKRLQMCARKCGSCDVQSGQYVPLPHAPS